MQIMSVYVLRCVGIVFVSVILIVTGLRTQNVKLMVPLLSPILDLRKKKESIVFAVKTLSFRWFQF